MGLKRVLLLLPLPLVGLIYLTLGELRSLHAMEDTMTTIWEDGPVLGGKALEFIKHANKRGSKLSSIANNKGHHGRNMFASIGNRVAGPFRALQEPSSSIDATADDRGQSNNSKSNPSVANRASSVIVPRTLLTTTTSTQHNNNNNNNHSNTIVTSTTTNTTTHRIPRRLIFTFSTNLIKQRNPEHLHDNVLRTIRFFSEAWGLEDQQQQSQLDVLFLTDIDCIRLLEQVEPRMVLVFQAEKLGSYKADMCRLAALYVHGGYYLDVDLEPVQALYPPPEIDFITSKMPNGMFFQAIMAASPGHPVLKSGLESMIVDWYMVPSILREFNKTDQLLFDKSLYESDAYNDKRLEHVGGLGLNHDPKDTLMGPMTLRLAFDRNQNATNPWFLLEEDNSKLKLYPDYLRKATTKQSWGCNYMVHDPENKTAYFYSRCRGTWLCPFERN